MAKKKQLQKSSDTERTDGRRMKGLSLPPSVRIVRKRIELPKRRRGPGQYGITLETVLQLKPTMEEMGFDPHVEWKCKTDDELGRVQRGINAARKRDKRFKHITTRRFRNFEKKRFSLILWKYM